MKNSHLLSFLILIIYSSVAHPTPADEIWNQLFKAMRFSDLSRKAFAPACRADNPLSKTASYQQLCPKLNSIPDSIIESAALPYIKQYLSEDLAKQAIEFWTSDRGKVLKAKILKEIETGQLNQLNSDDLTMLETISQKEFSQALRNFSSDREQGLAVAKAMLNYEP